MRQEQRFSQFIAIQQHTNPGMISEGTEPAGSKFDLIYCNLLREFSLLFHQPWFLQGTTAPDETLGSLQGYNILNELSLKN